MRAGIMKFIFKDGTVIEGKYPKNNRVIVCAPIRKIKKKLLLTDFLMTFLFL